MIDSLPKHDGKYPIATILGIPMNVKIDAKDLRVQSGKSGSIAHTETLRLNAIKKEILSGNVQGNVQVDFKDYNRDGIINDGEYFIHEGIIYYNIKDRDTPSGILQKFTGQKNFNIDRDEYNSMLAGLKGNENRRTPLIRVDEFLQIPISGQTTTQPTTTENQQPVQPSQNINAGVTQMGQSQQIDLPKKPLAEKLIYPKELKSNQHFTDYLDGLEKHKESLMKKLNLNEDEYDNLAQFSLALIEAETQSGVDKKYRWLSVLKSFFKTPSVGISNIKVADHTTDVRALMKEYGITTDARVSNIADDDSLGAVATMILLGQFKKDYKIYQDNIASQYSDDILIGTKTEKEERTLKEIEYLTVRWKGLRVNEFDSDPNVRKISKANVDAIVDYRYDTSRNVEGTAVLSVLKIYNNKYSPKTNEVKMQ